MGISDSVAERIARLPCWQGHVDITPLSGGLSNENYKVVDQAGQHVVRFGSDYPFHHVIRSREVMVARAAHEAGFAPEVRYAEDGVMVTAFLNAHTFTADDVKSNAARIGQLLRHFHTAMAPLVTGPGFIFWVFHVIRDYAKTLEAGKSRHLASLPRFLADNQALENLQPPMPIVFGHHDLLPANFLDTGNKIWLIDFEYAGFGTCLFDLAGAASNALMTEDEAKTLLHGYFGHTPDAAFMRAFDAMQCASLLRETMWAMVSAIHLAAPGVDYDAYTAENLTRYEASLERFQSKHGKLET